MHPADLSQAEFNKLFSFRLKRDEKGEYGVVSSKNKSGPCSGFHTITKATAPAEAKAEAKEIFAIARGHVCSVGSCSKPSTKVIYTREGVLYYCDKHAPKSEYPTER